MRYDQLIPIIENVKPKTILEIGTWNGLRAIQMACAALQHSPKVKYIGFDLFEDATEETDAEELNVKAHNSIADVTATLQAFKDENPGFSFKLHKGNTRKTLKGNVPKRLDFAYIDGGHSVETIKGDYEAVSHAKTIVMDDYYQGGPDTTKFGCNSIAESMETLVLPLEDPVKGGGTVRMVVMPSSAWPGPINVVVKTRNCVPDEEIQGNIRENVPKISDWVRQCRMHSEVGVICSGGPSFKDNFLDVREWIQEGAYVFCVKTSHDKLIEEGIIPYGCFLLDPRGHVSEFIKKPHPEVKYFVASMVAPEVVDHLKQSGAQVIGYNALVGAGEQTVLKEFDKSHIMIGGGSTSAVRGISLLHAMGFRYLELYGFESSYQEKPEQTHGVKKKDPVQVSVAGRKFWTDNELIAQSQDFEKLAEMQHELIMNVHGDGLIPWVWEQMKQNMPEFEDLYG